MKLCSIASGSSGNCIYVGSNQTNLLVDAGISGKRILNGLDEVEVKPDTLQGVLITHEHSDHIAGVGVLARKFNVPIYGTFETLDAMRRVKSLGEIPDHLLRYINPDETFYINDIEVNPFSISHDASNPVCYTFAANGHKVGIATDLGKYDDYIISKLSDTEILILESNHDVNMLMVGKYPYYLKQRVLGDKGHLSNDTAASLICDLMSDKLRYIYLAHLSKENNYDELAYETVYAEMDGRGFMSSGVKLSVARRDQPSQLVMV